MAGGSKRTREKNKTRQEIATRDEKDVLDVDAFIEDHPDKAQLIARRFTSIHHGPLPPPEMLAQYEAAVPGLAERIVAQAEREQAHRHKIEKTVVSSVPRSQWLAFCITLVFVFGAVFLLYSDKNVEGYVTLGAGAAALVGAFLYGQRKKNQD